MMTGFVRALQDELHEDEHLPVIAKPFRMAELVARVRAMLGAPGAAVAVAAGSSGGADRG